MTELAADGVPVVVTCRVLKLARQPYYRWLAHPVPGRDQQLLLAMADPLQLKIQYFAVFREQRGLAAETLASDATTPGELYAQLHARHGFTLDVSMVRVAVNGNFALMERPLSSGDSVVFIPPVAGG